MSIELSITTTDNVSHKLKGAPRKALDEISKIVAKTALNISNDAKKRIAKGTKTGKVYDWEPALRGDKNARPMIIHGNYFFVKSRAKPHQASAPNESPASDRGTLLNSIISRSKELSAQAGSTAKYASWLEEGTKYMEARPFLQPAIDEVWPKAKEEVKSAVMRAIEA